MLASTSIVDTTDADDSTLEEEPKQLAWHVTFTVMNGEVLTWATS